MPIRFSFVTFYRAEEETYQITFRLSIRTLRILNKCYFAFILVFIDQIFWGHKLENCRKNTGRKCQAHIISFLLWPTFLSKKIMTVAYDRKAITGSSFTNEVRFSRGGTSGNSWWECAAQFSKSWPYFRRKNVIFHIRFQTWPLRNYVLRYYLQL